MIEIIALDTLSQFLVVEAPEVVLAEEVRLLDEGEQDLRMALEPARHGGRPAARRADDEQEPLDVLDTRHRGGTNMTFALRQPRSSCGTRLSR
jgi:hypothetical protein